VTKRTLAPGLVVIAILATVAACDDGSASVSADRPASSSSTPQASGATYSPNSIGFGEGMNTAGGSHRILSMQQDADTDAVDAPTGSHTVTALVSECASPRGSIIASSQGWTAVTDPASSQPLRSPVELQPTTEGAPSIDESRDVGADSCAMADLVFVVPDGTQVIGFHYQKAGSRTATWIETAG